MLVKSQKYNFEANRKKHTFKHDKLAISDFKNIPNCHFLKFTIYVFSPTLNEFLRPCQPISSTSLDAFFKLLIK